MSDDKTEHSKTASPSSNVFIAGVVEGFYGRPWTKQQRKHLFIRLRELGLNTYFYAPKDDVKHRGQWRELYTQEETDVLAELIAAAKDNEIDFVYALSPGIDIRYSDFKDTERIQDKFSQVRDIGCKSFALLFDDIETEMQSADREKFISFAAAQVSVTNEVFEFLGCPRFFFCPTEYCETRARPTLQDSEYLSTIGNKLMFDIHVMWTGPQVISQLLTKEHMAKVAEVIKRKPLIWDNLHANDYDPKRVFLGPFAGRSVELKECISGLLLNPNCKFEANFVPFTTLADWYHAECDAPEVSDSNAILEAGGVSPIAVHTVNSAKPSKLYHPLSSLREAVQAWMVEFQRHYYLSIAELLNDARLADVEMSSPKVLTELVEAVVNEEESAAEMNSLKPDLAEPMETASSSSESSREKWDSKPEKEEFNEMDSDEHFGRHIEYDQLATFVDLFFLPFENGRRGEEILENFLWLYENSWLMSDRGLSEEDKVATQTEWLSRFEIVSGYVNNIKGVFNFLGDCPNKQIVADLIPYIWESHGTVSVILGVLKWLKLGHIHGEPDRQYRFWKNFSKEEPWVSSGGFVNHSYRTICGSGDLHEFCTYKSSLPLSIVDFSITALSPENLNRMANLATAEDNRTDDQNKLNTTLFLDKYVHVFTDHDKDFVFIAEDDTMPDGHRALSSAIAVLKAESVLKAIPAVSSRMKEKYQSIKVDGVNITSIVEEIEGWYPRVPSFVTESFPSWLDVRFSATPYDAVPTKRMIHAVAVSLALAGSIGMFVTVPYGEVDKIEFFKNIGFVEITRSEDLDHLVLARSLTRNVENNKTPKATTE